VSLGERPKSANATQQAPQGNGGLPFNLP
jgi:hypothetical protein